LWLTNLKQAASASKIIERRASSLSLLGNIKESPVSPKTERKPGTPQDSSWQQGSPSSSPGTPSTNPKKDPPPMNALPSMTAPPPVIAPPMLAPPSSPPSISIPVPGAGDWKEAISVDGRKYYYNPTTRQTSWDKPVVVSNLIDIFLLIKVSIINHPIMEIGKKQ
jgi:hypothetical protein